MTEAPKTTDEAAGGTSQGDESGLVRLQLFLSECGYGSRRKCERDLIAAGRVAVNGTVSAEMGQRVDPSADSVTVDGAEVLPADARVYVMLNKPAGYVTTMSDEQGRPIAASLVPDHGHVRLFPVGRLDRDTTGLLLFMGDGRLSYRLLAPKYHVPKRYLATVEGKVFESEANLLRQGITVRETSYQPAVVEILHAGPMSKVSCTICEGKNHEVRHMFKAIGHPVVQLQRVSFGPVELGDLPVGECRDLTDDEVAAIKRIVDWC